MKKNLIILWAIFAAYKCFSQHIPPDSSPPIISRLDSTNLELSYVLKDKSRIVLSWKLKNNISVDYLTVERSLNGKDFEAVAILRFPISRGQQEWIDEASLPGKNYYRIRGSGRSGEQFFSKTILVNRAAGNSFRFYPNPVDNILIIRSDIPLDVQIADATGKVRINQPFIQGLQTINVSKLEKGIYVLRLTNRITNTVTQEELIKNK